MHILMVMANAEQLQHSAYTLLSSTVKERECMPGC